MRIGITADLHLTAREGHPERYKSLENILSLLESEHSQTLLIAGDLFDENFRNYSEFEKLCKQYPQIQVHIIPGNHDANITEGAIVAPNIHIYTKSTAVDFDSLTFLFVPYKVKTSMGDEISAMAEQIRDKEWILIGHGDYYGGVREQNPLERGTYMPLARANIEVFGPQRVFLGHIHEYSEQQGKIYYPGSPCALNITETGKRRFLIYDTGDGSVKPLWIPTDTIYFDETFTVVPSDDEVSLLKQDIGKRIESWQLEPSDRLNVVIRARANGYASDRSAILSVLKEGFNEFRFYEEPSIENLSLAVSDPQRQEISERTMKLIDELEWNFGDEQPDKQDVKLAAIDLIYTQK